MVRAYDADHIPAVYNCHDLPQRSRRDGVTQSYFRGMDCVVGFTMIEPHAESGPHDHPWEQVTMVLSGSCTFHVGPEQMEITEGDIFVIPPDIPHYAEPGSEPCTICFISPLREDFLPYFDYQREFASPGT